MTISVHIEAQDAEEYGLLLAALAAGVPAVPWESDRFRAAPIDPSEPRGAAEDVTAAVAAGRADVSVVEPVGPRGNERIMVPAPPSMPVFEFGADTPVQPTKRKRRTKAEIAADAAAAREAEGLPADPIRDEGEGEGEGETIEKQAAEASANAEYASDDPAKPLKGNPFEDEDPVTGRTAQDDMDEALMTLRGLYTSGNDQAAEEVEKLRAEYGVNKFSAIPVEKGGELLAKVKVLAKKLG